MNRLTVQQQREIRAAAGRRLEYVEAAARRLDAELVAWQAKNPLKLKRKIADDKLSFEVRVHIDPEPDIHAWGFQFGDVLHGMRSALDNLVTSFAAAYGVTGADLRAVQFPIEMRADKRRLDESMKRVKALPPEVREVVEQAQPAYRALKGETATPEHDALALLARFNNQDKHNIAIASGLSPQEWEHSIEIEFEDGADPFEPNGTMSGDLVDGAVAIHMTTGTTRIKDVKGRATMKGLVVARMDSEEWPVMSTLMSIGRDVHSVVGSVGVSVASRESLQVQEPYCPLDFTMLDLTADTWTCPTCGLFLSDGDRQAAKQALAQDLA